MLFMFYVPLHPFLVLWFYVFFLFCVMFVAFVQNHSKFWPCAVFEVTGWGVKAGYISSGANLFPQNF